MINGLYEDTKRKAEKSRVENVDAEFAVKDLPLGRTLGLIDSLID